MATRRWHGWPVLLVATTVTAAQAPGETPHGQAPDASRERTLAAAIKALPDPVVLIDPSIPSLHHSGDDTGTVAVLDDPGRGLRTAVRVTTRRPMRQAWDFQAAHRPTHALEEGDVLLASFWVRNPTGADGAAARTELVIERSGEPYEKLLTYPVNTTSDWVLHYVPFRAGRAYAPGQWHVLFRAGYKRQAFDLAELRLLHFGRRVDLRDLPRLPRTYPGIQPDAAWRAEAERRIDANRRADIRVEVTDAGGSPVHGAEVHIEMTRHAFWFGSAVKFHWIAQLDNPEHDTYRRHIEELFNHAVNENDLKWRPWEAAPGGRYSPERTVAALAWLKARDIHTKGHCIIWPSWRHTVPRLEAASDDPDAMRRIIHDHIADMAPRVGPMIDEWDVINEPFNNNDVMQVLGDAEMAEWFKLTRRYDPDARLYLNDWGILAAGGETDTPHQQYFENTIRLLLDHDAPLGGIGMQSHFGENVTPPEALWRILDRFAAFGLPIQITEFDLNTQDQDLLRNYTRDFYTACFAHEAVNGIVIWGFWAGAHWRPDAALFDRDWTPRANADVYRELVFDRWWTDEVLRTNDAGRAETRGFLGTYRVIVGWEQAAVIKDFELNQDGVTIHVTVPH